MASKNFLAPRLLDPPAEYSQEYMRKLLSVLRLYFNQLDNPSPEVASAQDVGTTKVVSALSFSAPSPSNRAQYVASTATQADLSNLRSGDIYVDTSASNVLKMKS